MSRSSFKDRMSRAPVNPLFKTSSLDDIQTSNYDDNKTSKHVNIQTSNYIRKTYYLSDDIIDALTFYSAFEKKDKSEIVREALRNYIPFKYFDM